MRSIICFCILMCFTSILFADSRPIIGIGFLADIISINESKLISEISENLDVGEEKTRDINTVRMRLSYLNCYSCSNAWELKLSHAISNKTSIDVIGKAVSYNFSSTQLSITYIFTLGAEVINYSVLSENISERNNSETSYFFEFEIPQYLLTNQGFNPILSYRWSTSEYYSNAYQIGLSYLF